MTTPCYCHNCVLFAGGEIDLSGPTPQVTMQCRAEQYQGPRFSYKPGNAKDGWRSSIGWIERVYEDGVQVLP